MIVCTKCGADNQDDALVCRQCGRKLQSGVRVAPSPADGQRRRDEDELGALGEGTVPSELRRLAEAFAYAAIILGCLLWGLLEDEFWPAQAAIPAVAVAALLRRL